MDVTVTTPAGTGAPVMADRYTYVVTVAGLSPTAGSPAGGDVVTITGSGFTGATAVSFGGTDAEFEVLSDTTVQATSPGIDDERDSPVDVTVTTPAGTSTEVEADRYIYLGITGLSPAAGSRAGGNTVTITGTGFTGATVVSWGGAVVAPSFRVLSDTMIQATAPAAPWFPCYVHVTVTTPAGTSAPVMADMYRFT